MKVFTPFISSGKGPKILRNCFFGTWAFVLIFKQSSVYTARNSSELTEMISGLSIILFSLYYTFSKKEKNTVWGIPTWVFGGLLLIIGTVFYLNKNGLI